MKATDTDTDVEFLELLRQLLDCHSTPGDEGEVARVLASAWQGAGWDIRHHGRYALSARRGSGGRRLLICAHMDSPGFILQQKEGDGYRAVTLGGPCFSGKRAAGVLKGTAGGRAPVVIVPGNSEGAGTRGEYWVGARKAKAQGADGAMPAWVQPGDRVCFETKPRVSPGGKITSAFLDNRLGCALLGEIARLLGERREDELPCEVVLGATACEEMGGFGAPVLARAVRPDAVICLDATYEDKGQDVRLGHGPVLTLSDESVLLSPATRDEIQEWFAGQGLPLQTEVYNVSATDSGAFPKAGLAAPVFALLLPTRHNHFPKEVADLCDTASLRDALLRLVLEHPAWLMPPTPSSLSPQSPG